MIGIRRNRKIKIITFITLSCMLIIIGIAVTYFNIFHKKTELTSINAKTVTTDAETTIDSWFDVSKNADGSVIATLDSNGTFTISGNGYMKDWERDLFTDTATTPWFSRKERINKVVIEDGVKNIGNSTFAYCDKIQNIEIANSVEKIGAFAFTYCNFERIVIPSSVKVIGEFAFEMCSLKYVTISEGLTDINMGAFSFCRQLGSIELPTTIKIIRSSAFEECISLSKVVIPSRDIEELELSAFRNCSEDINIYGYPGGKVEEVVEWENKIAKENILTFKSLIEEYDISQNGDGSVKAELSLYDKTLTISGTGNMKNWSNATDRPWHDKADQIKKLVINQGVKNIGNYAFYFFRTIDSVKIPEGVTQIGDYAFYYCSSLGSIEIPQSVNKIGTNAFNKCEKLESINIPEGVTRIEENAFRDCHSIKSIKLPETLKYIGNGALAYCYAANDIEIPSNVEYIGDIAFQSCQNLKKLVIPKNVVRIGDNAFTYCSNLGELVILAENAQIGENILSNANENVKVYVYGDTSTKENLKTKNISSQEINITSVTLDKTSVKLKTGGRVKLEPTVTVNDNLKIDANVRWSSSNSTVATIDNNGIVLGVKEGEAIITVTTERENKTATCNVTVESSNQSGGSESGGSQGNENQGDGTQGDENQGDGTQGDENQGDESQGDESQGDESQGDENQGDENQGDESQGDVNQGSANQGGVNQGNETENRDEKNEGASNGTTINNTNKTQNNKDNLTNVNAKKYDTTTGQQLLPYTGNSITKVAISIVIISVISIISIVRYRKIDR